MLATTIQITNNPPHTPTPKPHKAQAGYAGNHHPQAADAHTVLNVNPTVCSFASNSYAQPKHAPTPTTNKQ